MTVSGPDSTHWCAILLSILGTLLAGAYLTLQTASTWVLERSKRCHSQIAKNRGSESRKIGALKPELKTGVENLSQSPTQVFSASFIGRKAFWSC